MNRKSILISTLLLATTCTATSTLSLNAQENSFLTGANRFETACNIARKYYKSSDNVILVNSRKIADSLAVIPYARIKKAPILLTDGNSVDKKTMETINSLKAKNRIIVGGEMSVSNDLQNSLSKNYAVTRIAGSSRIDTSKKIFDLVSREGGSKEIFIVNGYKGIPDAASIGEVAGEKKAPILYVNEEAESKFLSDGSVRKIIVGGFNSVSKFFDNLPNTERIAGVNRHETNGKIIEKYMKKNNNVFFVKDGMGGEDSLVDALLLQASLISGDNATGNVVFLTNKEKGLDDYQKRLLKRIEGSIKSREIIGINEDIVNVGKENSGDGNSSSDKKNEASLNDKKIEENKIPVKIKASFVENGGITYIKTKTVPNLPKSDKPDLTRHVFAIGANGQMKFSTNEMSEILNGEVVLKVSDNDVYAEQKYNVADGDIIGVSEPVVIESGVGVLNKIWFNKYNDVLELYKTNSYNGKEKYFHADYINDKYGKLIVKATNVNSLKDDESIVIYIMNGYNEEKAPVKKLVLTKSDFNLKNRSNHRDKSGAILHKTGIRLENYDILRVISINRVHEDIYTGNVEISTQKYNDDKERIKKIDNAMNHDKYIDPYFGDCYIFVPATNIDEEQPYSIH